MFRKLLRQLKKLRPTVNDVRAVTIFTAVLALVAVLQLVLLYTGGKDTHDLAIAANKQAQASHSLAEQASKQVGAMKTQNEKLQKSLEETQTLVVAEKSQAKSTRKLAEASQQSASNALGALRLAQQSDRAWVSLILSAPNPVAGKPMKVTAAMKNVGHAPAYIDASNLAGKAALFMSSSPEYVVKPTDSQSVLFPGESDEMPGKANHFVTFQQYNQITRGATTFYIWARVNYRSSGDPTEHSTHTCVRWSPSRQVWTMCHTYNTAD